MKQVLQFFLMSVLLTLLIASCSKDKDFQQDDNFDPLEAANSVTPDKRDCAAQTMLEKQLADNPEMAARRAELERFTQNYAKQMAEGATERNEDVITIPVVVHVIYKTAAQNISDAQIASQMQVLNDDFRRLNGDADNTWSQAADSQIEFCMATTDPDGNPTNGITRTSTSVSSFGDDDQMKFTAQGGKDAWPTDQYLNIWVCNMGGGILGYAQFPGGPADKDGVVTGTNYFGTIGTAEAPFDGGRTTTHEVGHWLNLYHIWGDGGCGVDDEVNDTPESDAPNFGCATGHSSCGSTDMVENYMDYSDDACMNLFTQDQKTRMRALFTPGGFRYNLGQSNACGGSGGGGGGGNGDDCTTPASINVSNVTSTTADITWSASTGADYYRLRYRVTGASAWSFENNITATNYTLTGLAAQTAYEVQVQAFCNGSFTSNSSTATFTTVDGGNGEPCDTPTEINASDVTNNSAVITWSAVNGAQNYRLRYRIVGSATWTFVNNISDNTYTLTGLTAGADYQAKVQARCDSGLTSPSSNAFFTTEGGGGNDDCNDNNEPNDNPWEATDLGTNSSTTNALISSPNDIDWYTFSNSNAKPNIKVRMIDLPADYDIYLYFGGELIDYSFNAGTQNEVIFYNTNVVGEYTLVVEGYDGAHDADDCYELRVRTRADNFFKEDNSQMRRNGKSIARF